MKKLVVLISPEYAKVDKGKSQIRSSTYFIVAYALVQRQFNQKVMNK